jgi:hypothetical protein
MVIKKVSLYEHNYKLKKNIYISEQWKDEAEEISLIKKNKLLEKSETVDEVLYIEEDTLNFFFVASMLFSNAPIDKISEYVGVSDRAIKCFSYLFFNLKDFRGPIAKINFFKELLFSKKKEEQQLGIILKQAHSYGYEYLEWKFALVTSNTSMEDIVKNTFKDMYFKYAENSVQSSVNNTNEDNVVRMGRQLISAAIDVNKALTSQGGGSTFDEVKQYLLELNDSVTTESEENAWEEEVEILDIEIENEKTGE